MSDPLARMSGTPARCAPRCSCAPRSRRGGRGVIGAVVPGRGRPGGLPEDPNLQAIWVGSGEACQEAKSAAWRHNLAFQTGWSAKYATIELEGQLVRASARPTSRPDLLGHFLHLSLHDQCSQDPLDGHSVFLFQQGRLLELLQQLRIRDQTRQLLSRVLV